MPVVFKPQGSVMYRDLRPFLGQIELAQREESVTIDLSEVQFSSPGAMVPLIALVDDLRRRGQEMAILLPEDAFEADYFAKAGWRAGLLGAPLPVDAPSRTSYAPLQLFRDHHELFAAVDMAISVLAGVAKYPKGVLSAVEWCLNEVADNVLLHAGDGVSGWLQVVAQPGKNLVNFTVADRGRGIRASLALGYPELGDDVDALRKAIQPRVTRDEKIGQGNGLAGTVRIAEAMHGYVNILSGHGEIRVTGAGDVYASGAQQYKGTVVDLTLPTKGEVDVGTALWGHRPLSRLETLFETQEGTVFRVRQLANGYGTRWAGRELANRLANLLDELAEPRVVVDFGGVNLVSASFADEFLGRLAGTYGLEEFSKRVALTNMNELVSRTVNAVITQRVYRPGRRD